MTTEIDGVAAIDLRSEAGGLEASVVPGAGMVVCSLRHRGEELLGQRRGLRAYVEQRSTMGIPLLYPWANRLGATRFEVAGRRGRPRPRRSRRRQRGSRRACRSTACSAAASGWRVDEHDRRPACSRRASTSAPRPGLIDGVPVPAPCCATRRRCTGSTLSITTTVEAYGGLAGPDRVRLSPVLPSPRDPARASGRWRSRFASGWCSTTGCCRPANASRSRSPRARSAGADLRRRLRRAARHGRPFSLVGGAPPDRGRASARRTPSPRSTRPRDDERDRVRADDRAHQRARPRRPGAAAPAARATGYEAELLGSPSRDQDVTWPGPPREHGSHHPRRVLRAASGAEPDGVHARLPHHPRLHGRGLPGDDADRQLHRAEEGRRGGARARQALVEGRGAPVRGRGGHRHRALVRVRAAVAGVHRPLRRRVRDPVRDRGDLLLPRGDLHRDLHLRLEAALRLGALLDRGADRDLRARRRVLGRRRELLDEHARRASPWTPPATSPTSTRGR